MPIAARTSWEEYDGLAEDTRAEYIDGRVVVNPSPERRHQHAVHRLVSRLEAAAIGPAHVVAEWAWKPGNDEFVPDVIVTQRTEEQVRFTGVPLLVVEVLSSNRAHDLVVKSTKYAQAGLQRYWIVDPGEVKVTAYELSGGAYEEVGSVTGSDEARWDFGAGQVRMRAADLVE